MNPNKLYIKNMVCPRCVWAVESVLNEMDIRFTSVKIGEVELASRSANIDTLELDKKLRNLGFELVEEKRKQTVEKIKSWIIYWVKDSTEEERLKNFSDFLSSKLRKDYRYMSTLFSEIEHITIEKAIIQHKVDRIKEFIAYDELNLAEISFKMGYSSPAHLSGQFKQVTGMTPGQFKKILKK
jgi:AraC family transcriptional regulator